VVQWFTTLVFLRKETIYLATQKHDFVFNVLEKVSQEKTGKSNETGHFGYSLPIVLPKGTPLYPHVCNGRVFTGRLDKNQCAD
jgi:hypothetical protein